MVVPKVCRVEFTSHILSRKTFVTGRFNVRKAVTICSPVKEYGDKTNKPLSSTTTSTNQVLTSTTSKTLMPLPTTSTENSTHSNKKESARVCKIEFKQVPYPRQHLLYGLPRLRPFLVCPRNEKPIPLTSDNVKTDTTISVENEVTTESSNYFLSSIVHVV